MAEHWRDESGLNLQLMELVLPKLGQKDAHRAGSACPCFALMEITDPGNSLNMLPLL